MRRKFLGPENPGDLSFDASLVEYDLVMFFVHPRLKTETSCCLKVEVDGGDGGDDDVVVVGEEVGVVEDGDGKKVKVVVMVLEVMKVRVMG